MKIVTNTYNKISIYLWQGSCIINQK